MRYTWSMDEEWAKDRIRDLETENDLLHADIDRYREELDKSNASMDYWEEQYNRCHQELTELQEHFLELRKVWKDELCSEFGHNIIDGSCADCIGLSLSS